MVRFNNRDGFAIPVAILVIGILSISIAAGFSLVISERRGVDDQKAQVTAFVIAQRGLETFFVKRDSLGFRSVYPAAREGPVRIYFTGGYADVELDQVKAPKGTQSGVYVIRSKGTQTQGAVGTTPAGVRTVAQYATWDIADINVEAGWTAISGIQKNGSAGSFLGKDGCGDSASIAGVAVPVKPGFNRPSTADSVDYLAQTINLAAAKVEVDWAGILAGTAITPNIVMPGGTLPNWSDTTYYPTIFVNGDLSTASSYSGGRGILIVKGDLFGGNGSTFTWNGLVLVGGDLTGNGTNLISGAIISALNAKLGQTVPINIVNGTKLYQYNSCEVAKALRGMGALIPLSNRFCGGRLALS